MLELTDMLLTQLISDDVGPKVIQLPGQRRLQLDTGITSHGLLRG